VFEPDRALLDRPRKVITGASDQLPALLSLTPTGRLDAHVLRAMARDIGELAIALHDHALGIESDTYSVITVVTIPGEEPTR
jgi:hypothetical protein